MPTPTRSTCGGTAETRRPRARNPNGAAACDNPVNFGGFNDPIINNLLDKGRSAPYGPARTKIYEQINKRFAAQLWNLWSQYTLWTVAYKPVVHNVLGPHLPGRGRGIRGASDRTPGRRHLVRRRPVLSRYVTPSGRSEGEDKHVQVIVRRVIQLIVVLIVVTFFASLLTSFLPGDPVTTIAPFSSEADRAQIRDQLNLNENIVVRYGDWLGHFLTGDMGREYAGTGVRGQSISARIQDSLPRSLLLMLYVQILTLLIAVPLGVYTAYRAGSRFDDLSNGFAFMLLSIPVYVIATLMLLFFSIQNHVPAH